MEEEEGKEEAQKEGRYIYCIIEANQPQSFGQLGIGGRNDMVYTICLNGIAAVVSNSPIKKYPLYREYVVAHRDSIVEAMKEYTVLPVRFCTIAEDEEKIKKILEKEHDRFVDLLGYIEGKKELGLTAVFKKEGKGIYEVSKGIYKDILEKYRDIRILKEKLAALPPKKTYLKRVEIGRMIEAALQTEKEIYKDDILNILSPLAVKVKTPDTYGEQMIINAAFLVEKHKETEFDQKVRELGTKYGDKIKFRYVGDLPPYNFVNIEINLEEY